MPPLDSNFFTLSSTQQNISWTRGTIFPFLSSFKVNATNNTIIDFYINFENTPVEWILVGGDIVNSNTVQLPGGNIVPELQNLNLLTGNFYTVKIIFTSGNLTKTHTINLTIVGEYSSITSDKDNYSVIYNRITNTLTGDTLVNIIENTNLENISFETVGTNLFKEKTAIDSFTLEEDPAFPFANSSDLPVSGTKLIGCRLRNSTGNVVYAFKITLNVINTNDITTDSSLVNFSLFKHLSEVKISTIKIINPANINFTVTTPSFITLNPTSGNSSTDIVINTQNSADLEGKLYSGEIEIHYNSNILKIPVTVNNIDFINFPIGDYNFCLDNFIMEVHRITDTARLVRISMEIQLNTDAGISTVNSSYQIAYYNDTAKTDVGTKIHNLFPIFSQSIFEGSGTEFNNVFIYKPAIVKVTIEELDSNYSVVFSKVFNNIKLFPGKKPKMFPLFTNSAVKRIYADSSYIFTYVTDLVEPSDIVGYPVNNNPFLPGEVNAVYFTDSDGLVEFGDYKKILGVDFIRIPKGDNQMYFQYINENLVPELFVFNGDYYIEDNYEHNFDDDENYAKKYDCKVVAKITLNTGFILKEEAAALSQMNRRNLGFLKIEDDIYKVFPTTSKLRRTDSTQNVNNYELEFLIVEYGN